MIDNLKVFQCLADLYKIYFYSFIYVCVSVCVYECVCVCVQAPIEARREHLDPLELELQGVESCRDGCWEQQVFLITKPSALPLLLNVLTDGYSEGAYSGRMRR